MATLDARTAVTHPLGPCSESVESQIPEVLLSSLLAYSGMTGKSRSEIVRDAITAFLFGQGVGLHKSKRSLDAALEGLAFVAGVDKEEYVRKVLASHAFGELHVIKYGPVGMDEVPEQSPAFSSGFRQR